MTVRKLLLFKIGQTLTDGRTGYHSVAGPDVLCVAGEGAFR